MRDRAFLSSGVIYGWRVRSSSHVNRDSEWNFKACHGLRDAYRPDTRLHAEPSCIIHVIPQHQPRSSINSFVESSVCSNRLERDGRGKEGPEDPFKFGAHGRRPSFCFPSSSLPTFTEYLPSLRLVALYYTRNAHGGQTLTQIHGLEFGIGKLTISNNRPYSMEDTRSLGRRELC